MFMSKKVTNLLYVEILLIPLKLSNDKTRI